jgi:hypothetical protein
MLEVRREGVQLQDVSLTQLRIDSCVSLRELLQVERPLSSSTQPRILPREFSIPFHLGAARGIIFKDRVLLFTEPNLSSIPPTDVANQLLRDLSEASAGSATRQVPFEFLVLEALLWAAASRQEKRVAYVSRVLQATIRSSNTSHSEESNYPLLTLMPLSTTLAHYELVSRGLMQCVRSLLDNEYEMEALSKGRGDSWVLEEALEAVHHSAAGTTLAAVEMTRQLHIKRDLLTLHQRAFQNNLLTSNIFLTRVCLALSAAMWSTSLFGQNLQSGLENMGQLSFFGASAASMLVGAAAFHSVSRLRRVRTPLGGPADDPQRLDSLQSFLLQLDVRLDSAKATLAEAQKLLLASDTGSGAAGSLTKEDFCALHLKTHPKADLAGAELLFDMLDQGAYKGSLDLNDLERIQGMLEGSSHTIRAGITNRAAQIL